MLQNRLIDSKPPNTSCFDMFWFDCDQLKSSVVSNFYPSNLLSCMLWSVFGYSTALKVFAALQVFTEPLQHCLCIVGPFSVNNDRIELYWSSEGWANSTICETDSRFHTPKRCLSSSKNLLSSGLVISLPNSDYARYNQSTMPTCQNTEEWEFMIKCSLKSLLHFGLWIHLATINKSTIG